MAKKAELEEKEASPRQLSAPSPAPPSSVDLHPYARGSAIEVIHGVKEKADSWWTDDSEGEQEEHTQQTSIRLCDVIDRVSIGNEKWRYYVHYRDFNRRMDEWVGMERIVSPPSVGNTKARALKKEEERKKRKQLVDELTKKEAADLALAMQSRASRRARGDLSENQESAETPRMTRRQRRRSTTDDDGTVIVLNIDKSPGDDSTAFTEVIETKEVVQIPTPSASKETTIGEHVVATIPAHELDEHEGLDEASLREHEEVTKSSCRKRALSKPCTYVNSA